MTIPSPTRRRLLRGCAALVSGLLPTFARSQPSRAGASGTLGVCQLVDTSVTQQDLSKDFLVGSRAAWQEVNARGGLRGRKVQHTVLETDGTPGSIKAALENALESPSCVALTGTVGDPLAAAIAQMLRKDNTPIAHVAPWLQTTAFEADGRTFSVFASRDEQIAHALKMLSVMGMSEIGAVYATRTEYELYRDEVERASRTLQLRARHFNGNGDLRALGQSLAPTTPAVLLFLGGTPELVQLSQGLDAQARQRYVIAMADVNLQTVLQMGAARKTPLIATQIVPVVNSSAVIVRNYRESLARFFDEPPAPLSLAGYISARVAHDLLASVEGTLGRSSVLAAAQRNVSYDLGGFRVQVTGQRRAFSYVTQSMLTADGRLVG